MRRAKKSRVVLVSLATATMAGISANRAWANTVYTWASLPTGNWSTAAWTGGTPVANGSATELDFNATAITAAYTSTDDIANAGGTFNASLIQLNNANTSATDTIAGTNGLFTAPAGTSAFIVQNGVGAFNISAPLVISSSFNAFNGSGTGLVTLSGGMSGAGNVFYNIANLNITAPTTFTGTTNIFGVSTSTPATVTYSGSGGYSPASTVTAGTLTIGASTGSGVLNLNTSGSYASSSVSLGSVSGLSGVINQTSGTFLGQNTSGLIQVYIGSTAGGYGSWTLAGGSISAVTTPGGTGGYIAMAVGGNVLGAGGNGIFTQTGGSLDVKAALDVGEGAGNGVVNFFGGTATVADFPSTSLGVSRDAVTIGDGSATGVISIGSEAGGSAIVFAANNTAQGSIQINNAGSAGAGSHSTATGQGILNLNSGTLKLGGGGILKNTSTGISTVNLNGATIQATAANTALLASSLTQTFVSGTGGGSVNVYNGGVTINTNGFNSSIGASLAIATGGGIYATTGGTGMIAVSSGGGSGYLGAPVVNIIDNSRTVTSAATGTANISGGVITGVIITSPGQGYVAGDSLSFNFSSGGASSLAPNYTFSLSASDLTANGTGGFTKNGAGILALTGINTYTGPTVINNGELNVGSSGALSSGTTLSFNGGSLQYSNSNQTDYSPQFSTTAGQAYSIDTNGQNVSFAMALGSIGGSLTKLGSGTLTLSAPAAYSGATSVNAGTLAIAGLGNTAVTVGNGATLAALPGSGSIAIGSGSASVSVVSGGSLTLVDGSAGTLNINGGLTLGTAATGIVPANLMFDAGSGSDKIAVTGGVSVLTSGAAISISPISALSGPYTLITSSGGLGSGFSLASSLVTFGGTAYDLSLSTSTSTSEVLTASVDTSAASLFWKGASSGSWATAGNWNTDGSSNIASSSAPGAATNLTFSASSPSNLGTSLGANRAVNSITFSGLGAVSIATGNTLTLNATNANGNSTGDGITMSSGSGAATIGANIVLGSTQAWTNTSPNPLTVNGVISGPQALTLAGGGTFTLAGANSFMGGLTDNNSTLNLKNAAALGTGTLTLTSGVTIDNTFGSPLTLSTNNNQSWSNNVTFGGSGSLNMGSGTISLNSAVPLALNGSTLTLGGITDNNAGNSLTTSGPGALNIAGAVAGTTGLNLQGTGTVTLSGNSSYSGATNVSSGVLNLTGSTSGFSQLNLGGPTSAVMNINTAGTVTLGSNSTVSAGLLFSGAINQTNGTAFFGTGDPTVTNGNLASTLSIGGSLITYSGGAYGSYTLTNGTLSSGQAASSIIVGSAYGLGVFTQTGGNLSVNGGFQVGNNGTGVVTFTGGTATFNVLNYPSQTTALVSFGLASGAGGSLNLGTIGNGNASLNFSEGTISISGNVNLNTSINLNAGTLMFSNTSFVGQGFSKGVASGTALVNLNGAQIVTATPAGNTLMSANLNVYDYNGGANINVSTGTEIISSPIQNPGGNGIYKSTTFSGTATGAAGAGYIGAPEVTVIGGSGTMAQAIANIASNGTISGFTFTNPGAGYQVGDVLQFNLLGGGATTPAGTYNYTLSSGDVAANTQGGLVKTGAGTLILAAANTYAGTTNIAGGTLQFNAGGSVASPITLAAGTGLVFNPTAAAGVTVSNSITGNPALVQQIGVGNTILSGAANYVGPTNISAGTLVLKTSLPSSSVSVTGGTLNAQTGSGTLSIGSATGSGFLTLAPGANFSMVDGQIGTLNVNASGTGLTIGAVTGSASGMTFELGGGSTGTDLLAINGSASVLTTGAQVNISPLATNSPLPLSSNTFPLITATSGLATGFTINASTSTVNIGNTIYNLTLSETATAVSLVATQSAALANQYWGGTLSTSLNTVSTGSTNWFNDSAGSTVSGALPTASTNVFFSTSNANSSNVSVTTSAAISMNTLSFTSGAPGPITIGGTGAITIMNTALLESGSTGQGITLQNGAPAVTISAPIALGGPQIWNSSSSNLFTVAGNLNASANALTITGSANMNFSSTSTFNSSSSLLINTTGQVTLAGSTNISGGTNVTSGTLNIDSNTAFTSRSLIINGIHSGFTASNVTLDATVSGIALATASSETWASNFTFLGTNSLNLGSGSITVNSTSGSALVTLSNASSTLTMGAVSLTSPLYLTGPGNAVINGTVSGSLTLSEMGTGSLTITGVGSSISGGVVADNGTINISGAATLTGGGSLTACYGNNLTIFGTPTSGVINYSSTGASAFSVVDAGTGGPNLAGAIYQTNGTINASNGSAGQTNLIGGADLYSYGDGYYQLSGGTLNVKNNGLMVVGNGGVGAFLETAGTLNTTGNFSVGDNTQYLTQGAPVSGGVAVATFTGGTYNAGTGTFGILIGNVPGAAATLNIGTRAGGNATVVSNSTSGLQVSTANSGGTTSTLNLNSGILQFNSSTGIVRGAGSPGGDVVNFNGATVTAGAAGTVLMNSSIDSAYVYNGGAIFNTNGFNATVSGNLQPATGAGVYTNLATLPIISGGGTGYIFAPVVTVSGGSGTGATAIANISNGAVVGVIMTSPGQGYLATDQLNFSFSGGGSGSGFNPANFSYTLAANDVATNNGGLLKTGAGTLALTGTNTYTGGTNVTAGTLALPTVAAFPANTSLTIALGASTVTTNHAVGAPALVFPISTLTNNGSLDVTNNALTISNTSIGSVTLMAKAGYNNGFWNGTNGAIVSSMAAADTTHLTAVGVATGFSTFEGSSVSSSLVLAKFTYYGDANLDGTVDGTDYSRIDSGSLMGLTGWYNGDFNYDGVINGSDYTLIDNAFNTQGANIAAEVATPTAQIAGGASSAVPEPGSIALLGAMTLGLLGRRRRK